MRTNSLSAIPVIDLFAGPGGLGEGFASVDSATHRPPFKIALSIEKDDAAHRTLELRSFFRQFLPGGVPDEYYGLLRGQISREKLFETFPTEASAARIQAWKATLGEISQPCVDERIRVALGGGDRWVLCGGPPCQAFSLMGRSRSGGIDEKDDRVYLYREYLRILSEHRPPVFVMENVPGLLSSKVGESVIFKQMLADLRCPDLSGNVQKGGPLYVLYSLVTRATAFDHNWNPSFEPRDFVIKCEDYGIPQSRHRVIIVGVRKDLDEGEIPVLQRSVKKVVAGRVLRGLPRLRSGLTRMKDGAVEWRTVLSGILRPGILESLPNGRGASLKGDIGRMLKDLRIPRAGRGGEFVGCEGRSDYEAKWFCDPKLLGVCNHASRPHMPEDLQRYLFAACYTRLFGSSPELRDFPPPLLPNHKNVKDEEKKEYFDDRFRVQLASRPATTVTSHLAKDGHYYIHYDETQCRSLTVREAARLQTFPDNYFFCGTRTQQYVQVGNAVPPLLARQIASIVLRVLSKM